MSTSFVLLPGLGADSSLFLEQKKHFGDLLITPDWILPKPNESLVLFCHRYAEHLLRNELADLDEVFLGGFSFGGMVALEVAKILSASNQLKIKGVILLSSGRTQKILKTGFKLQAWVASHVPDVILRGILKKQMLHKFVKEESLTQEQVACLKNMLETLDLNFFKWSLSACATWNPQNKFMHHQLGFPIFEIQGNQDKIIPPSSEVGVVTIKDAKHLIQYTHAKEINQWIEQITQSG